MQSEPIMTDDDKAKFKEWAEAWKRVNEITLNEYRQIPLERRMEDFCFLFDQCKYLGWDKRGNETALAEARERWNALRRAYAAQATDNSVPSVSSSDVNYSEPSTMRLSRRLTDDGDQTASA